MISHSCLAKIPTIYAAAGSPAAGKTTFVAYALKQKILPGSAFVHDCDWVMTQLEGYQADLQLFGAEAAFKKWELPARALAEVELQKAITEGRDVIYDRSCALASSYSFLKKVIQNNGYQLVMHVVYLDKDKTFSRAKERESKTGRHIPESMILERLEMISALWLHYLSISQEAFLYVNRADGFVLISKYQGKKLSIENPEIYEEFLSYGKMKEINLG